MKELTKITYRQNADAIFGGKKFFDFFPVADDIQLGDRINYEVYEDMKHIRHPITRNTYEVVLTDRDAPTEKGWMVAGFRRVRTA